MLSDTETDRETTLSQAADLLVNAATTLKLARASHDAGLHRSTVMLAIMFTMEAQLMLHGVTVADAKRVSPLATDTMQGRA